MLELIHYWMYMILHQLAVSLFQEDTDKLLGQMEVLIQLSGDLLLMMVGSFNIMVLILLH